MVFGQNYIFSQFRDIYSQDQLTGNLTPNPWTRGAATWVRGVSEDSLFVVVLAVCVWCNILCEHFVYYHFDWNQKRHDTVALEVRV